MWYVIAFIAGLLIGLAGVICFLFMAISSMAKAEDEMLRNYTGTEPG